MVEIFSQAHACCYLAWFCIMWRRSKHDLVGCCSCSPRHGWWRNHSVGADNHFGHRIIARVCVPRVLGITPQSLILNRRGKYGGYIGATWGIARSVIYSLSDGLGLTISCSVIGPLLGGVRVFMRQLFPITNSTLHRFSQTTSLGDGTIRAFFECHTVLNISVVCDRCFFINL